MKSIYTFCLISYLAAIASPNAFAGGALVLYFEQSGDANSASADDHGAAGGSSGGASSSSDSGGLGGNASGQSIGSNLPSVGQSQSASTDQVASDAQGSTDQPTAVDVQNGPLDEVKNELAGEIAANLETPGIVGDLELADLLAVADSQNPDSTLPQEPQTSDFASAPDATGTGEIKSDPFPTSLPPVLPNPLMSGSEPTFVSIPSSPSSPEIDAVPFGSLESSSGPVLMSIPQAQVSTPEPTSAMVWMLGSATVAVIRRRRKANA